MRCGSPRNGTTVPAQMASAWGSRISRAAIQPPCFCAKLARLLQAAAQRHGEHDFARGGLNAQRVTRACPVAAHENV